MVNDVWNPELEFKNVFNTMVIESYGTNDNFAFWFDGNSSIMEYTKALQVTFACDFDFESFPFDSHECDLDFVSIPHLKYHINYTHDTPCGACASFCGFDCTEKLGRIMHRDKVMNKDRAERIENLEQEIMQEDNFYVFSM